MIIYKNFNVDSVHLSELCWYMLNETVAAQVPGSHSNEDWYNIRSNSKPPGNHPYIMVMDRPLGKTMDFKLWSSSEDK